MALACAVIATYDVAVKLCFNYDFLFYIPSA